MRFFLCCWVLFFFWRGVAAVRHVDYRATSQVNTLHVVTTWSAYATHMSDHAHAFRRLAGKHVQTVNYMAVNSGHTDQSRADINATARKHKIECFASYTGCSTIKAPSWNHACSLNAALQWLLANHTLVEGDIILFSDSDILPVDLNAAAIKFDVLGLPQEREGVEYLWPNLLLLRVSDRLLHALPDLDFSAMATPKGLGTDSGGQIAIFLRDNPWVRVSHFGKGEDHPYTAAALFVDRMKRVRSKYPACHPSELLSSHAATFIHLGSASSNWRGCPESVLAQGWHAAFRFMAELDNCVLESVTYESSPVEQWWLEHAAALSVDGLMNGDAREVAAYCDIVASQNDTVRAIVKAAAQASSTDDLDSFIFSSYLSTHRCTSGPRRTRSFIEPLFGVLRDPLSFCGAGNGSTVQASLPLRDQLFVESRDHLLLAASSSAAFNLFFDVSSSSGQHLSEPFHFYRAYQRVGILFDRYIAWGTPNSVDPRKLFAAVPDDLIASYQHINIPIDGNTSSPSFPVNLLQSLASPRDFVSVKLDVVDSGVEAAVVSELLNANNATLLVNELFWRQRSGSLRDQYKRLLRFRQMGMRAHAWP